MEQLISPKVRKEGCSKLGKSFSGALFVHGELICKCESFTICFLMCDRPSVSQSGALFHTGGSLNINSTKLKLNPKTVFQVLGLTENTRGPRTRPGAWLDEVSASAVLPTSA